MKTRMASRSMLAALAVALAAVSCTRGAAAAGLTGGQVLQRCERAYRSLKTYSGTTHVLTKSTISGFNATYKASATVWFVRPGRIRVEGTMMGGGGHFAIVSDGKTTWQTDVTNPSHWQQAPTTEMAIAAFTGVSQNAATTIPALLIGARWGDLFAALTPGKVSTDRVNGRATYRVEAEEPTGRATLWIDCKTFLLAKVRRRTDLSRVPPAKMPPEDDATENVPKRGVLDVTETFTNVRVNASIPAARFARPAGAPR